jgi:hypothetical protein
LRLAEHSTGVTVSITETLNVFQGGIIGNAETITLMVSQLAALEKENEWMKGQLLYILTAI